MTVRLDVWPQFAILLVLVGTTMSGIAGCGPHPAPPAVPTPVTTPPPVVTNFVVYEVAKTSPQRKLANANGLYPVPVPDAASNSEPILHLLRLLIRSRRSPIPKGTRILDFEVDPSDGVATLDLSAEFVSHFGGGDEKEEQVVTSILGTLGQFPSVKTVQFLVEGKKIDSLGGMQDLSSPLPVISPEDMQQPAGADIAPGSGSVQGQ